MRGLWWGYVWYLSSSPLPSAFSRKACSRACTRPRKKAPLGESEARLAKMIEASPEAITIASIEDGTFIAVNPAGQRLCGYTRAELIGNSAVRLGFYVDPEERRSIVADLRRDEGVYGREVLRPRKDGEVRETLTSGV